MALVLDKTGSMAESSGGMTKIAALRQAANNLVSTIMTTETHGVGPLDVTFTETLVRSPARGGWTYVVWPESTAYFGTGGRVKVRGTIDGEPFETSFMALGDGRHKLPVANALRVGSGKREGDRVVVHLTERLA